MSGFFVPANHFASILIRRGTNLIPRIRAIIPIPTGAATVTAEVKSEVTPASISEVIGNVAPSASIASIINSFPIGRT